MKITKMTLAGLYVIVAKALASSALADDAGLELVTGTGVTCKGEEKITSNVSQPNTTVAVTCPGESKLKPELTNGTGEKVYFNEQCTEEGVLSSVCPGASVTKASKSRGGDGTTVNVYFPQLPTTRQVVCLKCKNTSVDCTAIIAVAPASPQGPQACAVPGKSVTLQVNQAGGSAQFACGGKLTLAPSNPTQAYADDCSKVETLKDMTRTDKEKGYSTLVVNKLTKKKLCYLCEKSGDGGRRSAEGDRCTVYVQVGGTRRFSSSIFFGFTLPCLATMLGFT